MAQEVGLAGELLWQAGVGSRLAEEVGSRLAEGVGSRSEGEVGSRLAEGVGSRLAEQAVGWAEPRSVEPPRRSPGGRRAQCLLGQPLRFDRSPVHFQGDNRSSNP